MNKETKIINSIGMIVAGLCLIGIIFNILDGTTNTLSFWSDVIFFTLYFVSMIMFFVRKKNK